MVHASGRCKDPDASLVAPQIVHVLLARQAFDPCISLLHLRVSAHVDKSPALQPLFAKSNQRLVNFALVLEFVRVFLVRFTEPKTIDSLVFCEPP